MNFRLLNQAMLGLVAFLLVLNSRTVVSAQERGVLLRLGDVTQVGIEPGVVWHLPVVDEIQLVDVRPRHADLDRGDYVDARGDTMRVDAWVTWRIRDLPRYYLRAGADPERVMTLIQPVLREGLQRAFVAAPWPELRAGLPAGVLQEIVRQGNQVALRESGIELLSLRLRRISYEPEVQSVVIDRMRLARDSQATALRADANAQVAAVRAVSDEQVAAERAKTDAQVARIRSDAGQRAETALASVAVRDPAFARYWRAVTDWRRSFGKPGDVFVLARDSDLAALRATLPIDKPAAVPGDKK